MVFGDSGIDRGDTAARQEKAADCRHLYRPGRRQHGNPGNEHRAGADRQNGRLGKIGGIELRVDRPMDGMPAFCIACRSAAVRAMPRHKSSLMVVGSASHC